MKLLILISALAVVNSRPQDSTSSPDEETVEIEKQKILELKPAQPRTLLQNDGDAKQAQSTKEILEKIIEINQKHGLTPKGLKTSQDYVQVPTPQRSGTAKQQVFQFPQSPFTNPIFDYLNMNAANDKSRQNLPQNLDKSTTFSVMNTNAQVNPEDNIPGQFIKRKITHHQTFIIPVVGEYNNMNYGQLPNVFGYPNQPPQQNPQEFLQQNLPQFPQNILQPPQNEALNSTNSSQPNVLKKTLENQTVENIKNIVNRELPPLPFFNPYVYAQNQIQTASPYYVFPTNVQKVSEGLPLSSNSYRMNGPSAKIPEEILFQQLPRPSRQWQWPLAQFFPIVIKDPLQQIFNAFTSMVEYGQQPEALCADEQKKSKEITNNKASRSGKGLYIDDSAEPHQYQKNTKQLMTMDIEDLEMTNDSENPMKLTFNFKAAQDTKRTEKEFYNEGSARVNTKLPQFSENAEMEQLEDEDMKGLLNIKDKKRNPVATNDENIKLFSKDSTGSGVFIHKLKVRKGGVAIAGPGGIATAGSGGTAIVGPNGYAYTQPDSLAIAGSGTKVIAVDPGINLSEIIDGAKKNKTSIINTRIGKVVAVGPTVYYNRGVGQPTKVTLLPYYGGAKGQTLQITEMPNGTVTLEIIPTPETSESSSETSHPSELEMPQLPQRPNTNYGTNIRNIHQTALNIIKLQEAVKRRGQLSHADEAEYRENLDSLGLAAENLAKLQGSDEDDLMNLRAGLSPWFERKKTNKKDKDKKKEEERRKEEEQKKKEEERKKKEEEEQKRKEEEKRKKEEEEQKRKEEEEKKNKEEEKKKRKEEEEKWKEQEKEKEKEEEKEEEEEEESDDDGVAVNLPPEDASVAEAKPVGLAVAGVGGVAASKPIATAVVGPGGLAIARPVGTAIAGVSPDQALVPIYVEGEEAPSKKGSKEQNKGEKKKIGTSEYLNRIISRYHQV